MERRQALAECFESFVDEGDDCMSTDNPHILSIGWALHGAKWDTKHAPRLFAKLSRSSTTVTQHHFVDFFLSKCMQLSDEKFDELLTALRSQADGDSCESEYRGYLSCYQSGELQGQSRRRRRRLLRRCVAAADRAIFSSQSGSSDAASALAFKGWALLHLSLCGANDYGAAAEADPDDKSEYACAVLQAAVQDAADTLLLALDTLKSRDTLGRVLQVHLAICARLIHLSRSIAQRSVDPDLSCASYVQQVEQAANEQGTSLAPIIRRIATGELKIGDDGCWNRGSRCLQRDSFSERGPSSSVGCHREIEVTEKDGTKRLLEDREAVLLHPAGIVDLGNGRTLGSGWECRTLDPELPLDNAQQASDGVIYSAVQNIKMPYAYAAGSLDGGAWPCCVFPTTVVGSAPEQPDGRCDVYYSTEAVSKQEQANLICCLGELMRTSSITGHCPMPNYVNLLDPNLLRQRKPDGQRCTEQLLNSQREEWAASEFDVTVQGPHPISSFAATLQQVFVVFTGSNMPQALIKRICDCAGFSFWSGQARLVTPVHDLLPWEGMAQAQLHLAIEDIFTAALPLLSRLVSPALMLPARLQAVVKAQSIQVAEGETYEGCWHRDGLDTDIVAVVLYYYRCHGTDGGDLEFASRRPRERGFETDPGQDIWDGDNDINGFMEQEMPQCRVPVRSGSLVVFSNYQLVHRVLPMLGAAGANGGDRDFLAFFVVSPRLPIPRVVPYVSEEAPKSEATASLWRQLRPSGYFGVTTDYIYSAGNGSYAQMQWIESHPNINDSEDAWREKMEEDATKWIKRHGSNDKSHPVPETYKKIAEQYLNKPLGPGMIFDEATYSEIKYDPNE